MSRQRSGYGFPAGGGAPVRERAAGPTGQGGGQTGSPKTSLYLGHGFRKVDDGLG